jgi:uncharacterized YigZ family protein
LRPAGKRKDPRGTYPKGTYPCDRYFTVSSPAESMVKVKGSRFLSFISPVHDKEEAESRIRSISRQYHDASHVCFAYRITGNLFRTSDAGEPSGTAGKPILEAIDAEKLFFVLCVVVRYFGGTKLGTGGLARAYAEAAKNAIEKAQSVEKWITVPLDVVFSHEWTGTVRSLLSKYGCSVEKTDFGNQAQIVFSVRKSFIEDLKKELADATSGKVIPKGCS